MRKDGNVKVEKGTYPVGVKTIEKMKKIQCCIKLASCGIKYGMITETLRPR